MSDENERLKKIEEELEARLNQFDSTLRERLTRVEARLEKPLGQRSTRPPVAAEPPRGRALEEQTARLVQHEPHLNINTRFVLLMHITAGRKNAIGEFLRHARDELGFAPPFALEGERR